MIQLVQVAFWLGFSLAPAAAWPVTPLAVHLPTHTSILHKAVKPGSPSPGPPEMPDEMKVLLIVVAISIFLTVIIQAYRAACISALHRSRPAVPLSQSFMGVPPPHYMDSPPGYEGHELPSDDEDTGDQSHLKQPKKSPRKTKHHKNNHSHGTHKAHEHHVHHTSAHHHGETGAGGSG